MPNNIDNSLLAAIRSMENAVIPAINAENPLALEQAAIVTKLLQFMRERIPYVEQRDRLELKIYANMAEELLSDIVLILPDRAESVQEVMNEVRRVLTTPTTEPNVLGQLAEELRSALSELARASQQLEEQQRGRIEAVIVQGSKRLLDLQCAWFAPTGLVANSALIPDLESQLRAE